MSGAAKAKLKRVARYLKGRQRCVLNFPWVGKLDDVIHVAVDADWARDPKTKCSTSGGVLAIGPCFTVRHWSVTQATVSLSSAESEAKAITEGCIEALCVKHLLEHQTARPFDIEVWTDSSSANAFMQRLGPGRRAKHLEVQTMWVQQLNKIGLISLNKLNTLENVADLLTRHVPRAVLDKLAGENSKVSRVHEHQSELLGSAVERLLVFDDGEIESLEDDVHSFVDNVSSHDSRFEAGCWDEHLVTTIVTPTTLSPIELCDSLATVLG